MGLDIDWLEDFVALAAAGTFSAAATQRNVTQPAFSRRIRALEQWIGAPLFTRSARGATLTRAGEVLQASAGSILRLLGDARRAARDAHGTRGRAVRFAATHTLSATLFPGWLRLFQRRAPDTSIYLMSDSLEACETAMLAGNADFLLCHHHPAAPGCLQGAGFNSVTVGRDRLVPMSAADEEGNPVWHLDRAQPRLLAYAPESGLGRIFTAVTKQSPAPQPVFNARLASTLLSSAAEGLGIAWLPQSLLDAESNHGLVRAGPVASDIILSIRLYRSEASAATTVEDLWNIMRRIFDDREISTTDISTDL